MTTAIFLVCLALSFGHTATAKQVHGNEKDRLALLEFKAKITEDPFGALSSWNESIHFCHWRGVTCGRRHHQRVTALNLISQKLTGTISPHIGNLSFLRRLVLANNSFTYEIPPEVGHLPRLRLLWLDNNSISGEIPVNICNCFNLYYLSLSYNNLVGIIPVELSSLSKLQEIYIDRNNLTGGIPPSIGNLSSIQVLYAIENSFSGNIPESLGRLTNLATLDLGGNRLFGTIPSSIFNLSSIKSIDLAINQIQGSLPWDLGITLPNLKFLSLALNQFTRSLPSSISNASKLEILQFSFNKFTGKVPPLDKLQNLWWLVFSVNNLGTGEADDLSFLSSLTNASKLYVLALNDNNFGGMLPEFVSNLSTNLVRLYLHNNKFFGNIPTDTEDCLVDSMPWRSPPFANRLLRRPFTVRFQV